jgi:allophanate hydrolase subunit 2
MHLHLAFSSVIYVALAIGLQCTSLADSIRFTTADGKFEVTGTSAHFVIDGEEVNHPTSITAKHSVVIERDDGSLTSPIPLSKL